MAIDEADISLLEGRQQRVTRRRWPWVLAVGLLVAGGCAGGYWWLVGSGAEPKATVVEAPGPVASVGSIVTNLRETQRPLYIQVTVDLEVDDEQTRDHLQARVGAVRDEIIGILRNKSGAELQGDEGMRALAGEIRTAVNRLLQSQAVTAVYFSDFIIQ